MEMDCIVYQGAERALPRTGRRGGKSARPLRFARKGGFGPAVLRAGDMAGANF